MTVDKSEKRIQEMFGEISPRYDFLNHALSGGTDFYWRWRAVRAVPPTGNGPILDVCTGTGDLAMAYWKKAKGRVPVVGSDFTLEMLQLAQRKSARQKPRPAGLAFVQADTQRLPFADDQFQVVSVAFGLRNVTHTRVGLAEMVRVCQPGGQVLVLEFSLPKNRLFGRLYQWYFRNVLPRIGQLLARNRQSAYNYLPQSVSEFPHGKALAELMEAAGLEHVTYKPLTFGIATLYWGTKSGVGGQRSEVRGRQERQTTEN